MAAILSLQADENNVKAIGLTHVTVRLRSFAGPNGGYEADFLVDTGATDSLAPAAELRKAGIQPVGKTAYELADGRLEEYEFGLAEIRFHGRSYGWARDLRA